jgi:SlyX protein
MKTDQQRITDLEISLAHLQRQYDLLNEVVTEQTSRLDRAVKRIKTWEQNLDRLKNAVETDSAPLDEKPPHY